MKILKALFIFVGLLSFDFHCYSQGNESVIEEPLITPLFSQEEPISMKLKYSKWNLRKETSDSIYLKTVLEYVDTDGQWKALEVKLRARGKHRRENCFFPPIKIKIKKKKAEGTLFEGNKELKLVIPCFLNKHADDYVLKELIAYKLYEVISPFHFKTRQVALEYTDEKGEKGKKYQLLAFLIEDIDRVAERNGARKLKRSVHPMEQDYISSIQNDFFQYMIGNTDYSITYQHNEKLIFINGRKAIPIPYDFDMSGLVNASYSRVSQYQKEVLGIEKVTDRLFRGFKRNNGLYEYVRQDYIGKEETILKVMDPYETQFNDPGQYEMARSFIEEFFVVLHNEKKYRNKILEVARIK